MTDTSSRVAILPPVWLGKIARAARWQRGVDRQRGGQVLLGPLADDAAQGSRIALATQLLLAGGPLDDGPI